MAYTQNQPVKFPVAEVKRVPQQWLGDLGPLSGQSRLMLVWSLLLAFCCLPTDLVAQDINDLFNQKPGRARLNAKPVAAITTSLTPQVAQPGDTITLKIEMDVPKGSHIYSMSPSFNGASKVKFEAEEGVETGSEFVADRPPVVEFVKDFDQDIEKYKAGKVTFSRQYKVSANAEHVRIQGILEYQICDDSTCRTLKHPFEEELAVSAAGSAPVVEPLPPVPVAARGPDPRFSFVYTHKPAKKKYYTTTVRLIPADARPGDTVTLEVHVDLEPGWHTFTTTLPEERQGLPTELEVSEHIGLIPIDEEFQPDRQFSIKTISVDGQEIEQEIYEEQVTWSRKFRLNAQTTLPQVKFKGSFALQVCDKVCIPPKQVAFEFPIGVGGLRGSEIPNQDEGSTQQVNPPKSAPEVTPNSKPSPTKTEAVVPPAGGGVTDLSDVDCEGSGGTGQADIRDKGVVYVLGVAFVFGLLALLTPCVFPMVPITVSFFLKQAGKQHSSPLKMALVYSGSIILTFTVLGLVVSALFGATYINTLANGIWLNLFLGLVLLFFSLNLLGLFDIAIPSWLLTYTGNKESSGGYLGVFFMALTFTLTSFTCTFAFLGLILVWAANGEVWWPLAGLISFSTAFALPFFLLALFPSYLHKLPKSGGWMNSVKVVMGFIELAFMLKFLSVADIGWNGTPAILDYHMVMTAWMVISIVTGLYLIGKIRLPHDTPAEYTSVFAMVMAMLFFGLAGYIGVGTFGPKVPEGFLSRQIEAFAPPQLEGGVGPDGPYLVSKHDKERYLLDFEAAKQAAIREKKPLFIDFTGVNCINCREMERVIAEGGIQDQLKKCIRVQLYCDIMPSKAVDDPNHAAKLVEANQKLQTELLGDASLPSYAVVSPDGSILFSKSSGKSSAEAFKSFMSCGLKKSKNVKPKTAGLALTAIDSKSEGN